MSVATLLTGAPKTRQAGGQEVQQAPMMNLPEKLLPARATLATKLEQIKHAMGDLADYSARIERADIDEARALESEDLSETEAMERIATAQQQKSIFKARSASREKAIATFSKELIAAINTAECELRGLVSQEVKKREDIIGARVVAALQVGNAVDLKYMGRELSDLLHFSGPIQVVRALGPSSMIPPTGNNDALVMAAKDVLTKYERVTKEAAAEL